VELEARTVIASRYDQSPSGTDVLDEPVVVVRAVGTTVVPKRSFYFDLGVAAVGRGRS
jgi:3-aminobutyryl-CoA ammonia-lyase